MNTNDQRGLYGGHPEITFDATGYFRLEKADRWWLVTPEGHAFLGFGLNHIDLGLMQRPENRAHWAREFAIEPTSGEQAWLAPFRRRVRVDLQTFGFNHLGCHSPIDVFTVDTPPTVPNMPQPEPGIGETVEAADQRDVTGYTLGYPYVHSVRFVDICHWQTPTAEDFRDVFAPTFEAHCDRVAREKVAPRAEDPHLIGYSLTDCPIFTEEEAAARGVQIYGAPREATPTWPRVLRNLGADAPGKQAYVRLMRDRYGDDITAFNATYDTDFASWDALALAENWRPKADPDNHDERHDNAHILEAAVERYYTVATETIRRHDPHHMIFGDKLNGNTNTPEEIVRLAGRYMDLIFYQWYATYRDQKERLDLWSELTGKALFNGDSSYSVPNPNMPHPLGPHYETQESRAAAFRDFADHAFARPDFVGWSWCGWMDSWATVPGQMERQHSGLQDPFGDRYAPMVEAMSDFSQRMYELARK